MLLSYEGYLEKGRVHTLVPVGGIQGRRRVIITVLDEPANEMPDSWIELDKIVSGMSVKPQLDDFPHCQLGRDIIRFEEV